VYFDGPRSQWSEKLHQSEVTFLGEAPWLWLARSIARQNIGNTGRCAYVITANGEVIEHVGATKA
jgi:hypothetical protein